MRDLNVLIEGMLDIVPDDHPLYKEIVSINNDAAYIAPDFQQIIWIRISDTLNDHIDNQAAFAEGWEAAVVRLWMNDAAYEQAKTSFFSTMETQ